jgi:hypothetical protein
LKLEAKKSIVTEWKTGSRLPSVCLWIEDNPDDDLPASPGFLHLKRDAEWKSPHSIHLRQSARLSPQPTKPMSPVAPAGWAQSASADVTILKRTDFRWQLLSRIEDALLRTCFQQGFKRHNPMSHAMGREST